MKPAVNERKVLVDFARCTRYTVYQVVMTGPGSDRELTFFRNERTSQTVSSLEAISGNG
jgi:hypothetical protein